MNSYAENDAHQMSQQSILYLISKKNTVFPKYPAEEDPAT
jgi:hypothetical protein